MVLKSNRGGGGRRTESPTCRNRGRETCAAREGRPGASQTTRDTRSSGQGTCDGRHEGPGGICEIRRAGRKVGAAREAHSYPRGGRGLGGAHTDSEATAAAGAAVATARRADKTKNVAGSTVE